ncbi:diacylglycerol/lipid kinase family protein [Rubrobacter indicoceani]|uniref:diacylglycerol/lipid kinase family protein n=1 Tax=Rubrobacter indicoceani TaxID=2051957 RepID=UPI0013C424BE|nr:diacylglycerol kinase family protein [Rubrobacter indicoceani]
MSDQNEATQEQKQRAMDAEAVVIGNPASGNSDMERLESFARILEGRFDSVEVWPTEYPQHATELATKAGVKVIVAAGGDGTVNEVINGMVGGATLAILPLGTANVLARELGIPLKPEKACKKLLSAQEIVIDIGIVTNESGESRRFACMAGVGFDAHVINSVPSRLKKLLGIAAFALTAFKVFAVGRMPEISMTSAGETHRAQFAILANGGLYGGDFKSSEDASLTSGFLDVVYVQKVARLLRPDILTRILTQNPLSRDTRNFRATELYVESAGEVPVQIDGEVWGELPMKFHIEPRFLRVIR